MKLRLFVVFLFPLAMSAQEELKYRPENAAAMSRLTQPGKWDIGTEPSPKDSEWKNVIAVLTADSPILGSEGKTFPKLVFRYLDGRTIAYVHFEKYVGRDIQKLHIKLGRTSGEEQAGAMSRDGKAFIFTGDALPILRELTTVASFQVRLTSEGGELVALNFPLGDGAVRAVEAIQRAASRRTSAKR